MWIYLKTSKQANKKYNLWANTVTKNNKNLQLEIHQIHWKWCHNTLLFFILQFSKAWCFSQYIIISSVQKKKRALQEKIAIGNRALETIFFIFILNKKAPSLWKINILYYNWVQLHSIFFVKEFKKKKYNLFLALMSTEVTGVLCQKYEQSEQFRFALEESWYHNYWYFLPFWFQNRRYHSLSQVQPHLNKFIHNTV